MFALFAITSPLPAWPVYWDTLVQSMPMNRTSILFAVFVDAPAPTKTITPFENIFVTIILKRLEIHSWFPRKRRIVNLEESWFLIQQSSHLTYYLLQSRKYIMLLFLYWRRERFLIFWRQLPAKSFRMSQMFSDNPSPRWNLNYQIFFHQIVYSQTFFKGSKKFFKILTLSLIFTRSMSKICTSVKKWD